MYSTPIHIVIVDDIEFSTQQIHSEIEWRFRGCRFTIINRVEQFSNELPNILKDPPDIFVLDLKLNWRDEDNKEESSRAIPRSSYFSGLSIADYLLSREATSGRLIILVSGAQPRIHLEEYPPNVIFFPKPIDYPSFCAAIESFLAAEGKIQTISADKNRTWRRIWSALELKPGAFGIRLNLKSLVSRKDK